MINLLVIGCEHVTSGLLPFNLIIIIFLLVPLFYFFKDQVVLLGMRCQLAFQFLLLVLFDKIFYLRVICDLLGEEAIRVPDT